MKSLKYFGAVAGIATFLSVFGMWAKITHQAYADKVFTIGMWTLALCGGVYVYFKFIVLSKKK